MLERARGYETLITGDLPPLATRFDCALSILTTCHLPDLGACYRWLAEHLIAGAPP